MRLAVTLLVVGCDHAHVEPAHNYAFVTADVLPTDGTCGDWTDATQGIGHGNPDESTSVAFADGDTGCAGARIYCLEP